MKNVQQELSAVMPVRWRRDLGENGDPIREIRLRLGMPPLLCRQSGVHRLSGLVTEEDLRFCLNLGSRYSPWNAATLSSGFLTAPGGHRIGICGEASPGGFKRVTSVCIRVSREIPGISDGIELGDNLLILGPPGSGKTTLLRDLIRRISRERQ